MNRAIWLLVVCGFACGGDDEGLPDVGMDAATDSAIDASGDAPVDAAPPETCEPGDVRAADCGNCGQGPQTCGNDGLWLPITECFDEGACEAGTIETEEVAMCATRRRLCRDTCEWGEWADGDPAGACDPGEQRFERGECPAGLYFTETCNATCEWGPPSCEDVCGAPTDSSNPDAREICIPEGQFYFGPPSESELQSVESFYIDRYLISVGRYKECVEAGSCSAENRDANFPDYDTDEFSELELRFPAPLSELQVRNFCRWSGKRLPTQAEWEMAARGPAPRRNEYIWDEGESGCDYIATFDCPAPFHSEMYPFTGFNRAVYSMPQAATYWGVELMVGVGYQPVVRVTDFGRHTVFVGPPMQRSTLNSDLRISDETRSGVAGSRFVFGRCVRDVE